MLKVFAGARQSGRTTQLIDHTIKYLRDSRKVSLMFSSEAEAHDFCRMLLITLLGKPVGHDVQTQHVVKLLESLGYQVNVFLLYSLRNVLRNSARDELVVYDGWRCLGDGEFREIDQLAKSRRVLTAIDLPSYRSLSTTYRTHSAVTLLALEGKYDDSSNGPVPAVDIPHAHQ